MKSSRFSLVLSSIVFVHLPSRINSFQIMSKRKFDVFCREFPLNSDALSSLQDSSNENVEKAVKTELNLLEPRHPSSAQSGEAKHSIMKSLLPSLGRTSSSRSSSSSSDSSLLFTKKDLRHELLEIHPFPSIRPSFRNQSVYTSTGIYPLDFVNTVTLRNDFFSEEVLQNYLTAAASVERFSGKSAFNSIKPRKEVCYTVDGKPFRYSRILHKTAKYPAHVLTLLPYFQEYIHRCFPSNKYHNISGSLDIIYSPEFERGKWDLAFFFFGLHLLLSIRRWKCWCT
jgi:hypothetical protein